MGEPSVHCQTFARSIEALPGVDDLLKAADPQQLEQLYREAGLDNLASNITPLRKANAAAQSYVELPVADYRLYAGYLSQAVKLKNCTIPPPDEALTVLVAARKAQLFDELLVLSHPGTGQALLVGRIKVGDTSRYFKIAHWGHELTEVEQLRKRQRRGLVKGLARQLSQRWSSSPRYNGSLLRQSLFYGGVIVVPAAICWVALLPINWFLFMAALITVAIVGGTYVDRHNGFDDAPGYTAGWAIALNIIAALVVGGFHLNTWNTASHTEELLVCGTGDGGAMIGTSKGDRWLDPGFYNGTYYPASSEQAAKLLVGNWIRVNEHGHSGFSGPFITEATVLRPGSCGK